ncbi:uncharacterized protein K02A2.6-like [Tachysurus vachellii]|uniref:uncharacterized protein K02A2.6-like n=1 Tax=Tachysurus vachellii TaxID=175792 RepID=UPI00296AFC24|nr:uncharacterized protein K02A2.6-like [Tachysurus vachellii]
MGKEAEQVYQTFTFGEGEREREDYDNVIRKLDDYFVPKVNVIHERARFHMRVQRPGEMAEEYIRSLHELASTCDFGAAKDENIRDRLVIGILDRKLSEKLQLMPDLTLNHAIELVRQSEQVRGHVNEQAACVSTQISEVTGARGKSHYSGRGRQHIAAKRNQTEKTTEWRCKRCGRNHGKGDTCPAKSAECRKCRKRGHFAAVCRTRAVHEVTKPPEGSNVTHFLGELTQSNDVNGPWMVTLPIQGTDVDFKIDMGADISVLSEITFSVLKYKPQLKDVNVKLESPGGTLHCKGQFTAVTVYRDKQYSFDAFVVAGSHIHNLLGRDTASAMGLVKRLEELQPMSSPGLGLVKINPIKICLKENAVPYSVHTARRVSIPLLSKVKAELERMVKCGVIQEITEPTEWCAPMVAVPKKTGQIRICVDLKQLNKAVKREKFVLPTIDDILPKLAHAEVFSLLDAASGFWQLPLDMECAKLKTFITPFGRYFFRRLPFGITSAPEIFQREMSAILNDEKGVAVFMDDILVYGNTPEEHEQRLQRALKVIDRAGLQLNEDKCLLRQNQLKYLGHVIDKEGIRPDTAKVEAITRLEKPQNISELRRMLGMIHYLGRYVPHLSDVIRPLNELLKSDVIWYWGPAQEEAFHNVKQVITEAPVLAFYDVTKPTVVSADASSYGLGGVLLQDHDGQLKPVAYCSRVLTDAEKRYAQIEKECLAAVWSCERFSRFLYGLESFILQTDHKPLIPLINAKDLDSVPLRCQRLLLRMMRYNPEAQYVPGKQLVVADALSRHPQPAISAEVSELVQEVESYENAVSDAWPISQPKLDSVKKETGLDYELQMVKKYVADGWPRYAANVPQTLKSYYSARHHLSVFQDLVLYDDRIIIPQTMRSDILQRLHSGHQGIVKCRERAKCSVWWPGLSKEIQSLINNCKDCLETRPTQKREPLLTTPLPNRPWEKIGADICEVDKQHYLIVVDYFSRYIDIAHLSDLSGKTTRACLQNMFARWGCPNVLFSDNGPQFSGRAFRDFARDYDFQHVTSSPHYAQSNGEAERAVQTAKKILKQSDPFAALMSYRATPIQATGVSPSQLMMGRRIRTTVPTLESNLQPEWPDLHQVRKLDCKAKGSYRKYYNKRNNVRTLPEISPCASVAVKLDDERGWIRSGTVLEKCELPRSYIIQSEAGLLRRNRRHLMPTPSDKGPTSTSASQTQVQQEINSPDHLAKEMLNAVPNIPESIEQPAINSPESDSSQTTVPSPKVVKTRSGRSVLIPQKYKDFV